MPGRPSASAEEKTRPPLGRVFHFLALAAPRPSGLAPLPSPPGRGQREAPDEGALRGAASECPGGRLPPLEAGGRRYLKNPAQRFLFRASSKRTGLKSSAPAAEMHAFSRRAQIGGRTCGVPDLPVRGSQLRTQCRGSVLRTEVMGSASATSNRIGIVFSNGFRRLSACTRTFKCPSVVPAADSFASMLSCRTMSSTRCAKASHSYSHRIAPSRSL